MASWRLRAWTTKTGPLLRRRIKRNVPGTGSQHKLALTTSTTSGVVRRSIAKGSVVVLVVVVKAAHPSADNGTSITISLSIFAFEVVATSSFKACTVRRSCESVVVSMEMPQSHWHTRKMEEGIHAQREIITINVISGVLS